MIGNPSVASCPTYCATNVPFSLQPLGLCLLEAFPSSCLPATRLLPSCQLSLAHPFLEAPLLCRLEPWTGPATELLKCTVVACYLTTSPPTPSSLGARMMHCALPDPRTWHTAGAQQVLASQGGGCKGDWQKKRDASLKPAGGPARPVYPTAVAHPYS